MLLTSDCERACLCRLAINRRAETRGEDGCCGKMLDRLGLNFSRSLIISTALIYCSQVEMSGSSIFDYIHQNDHAEMAEQLGLGLSQSQGLSSPASGTDDVNSTSGTNNPDGWFFFLLRSSSDVYNGFFFLVAQSMTLTSSSMYKGLDRAFCIRMKSTLTKRGCHFKSSGYRVSFFFV